MYTCIGNAFDDKWGIQIYAKFYLELDMQGHESIEPAVAIHCRIHSVNGPSQTRLGWANAGVEQVQANFTSLTVGIKMEIPTL